MTVFNLKKRFIISLVLLTLSLSLFVLASWGWFTQLFEEDETYLVGHVEVEIDPYFSVYNDVTLQYDRVEATFVQIQASPLIEKPGVYLINIVNNGSDYFFENFRLDIIVKSSVNTYFRIKIYEQLTLTYLNYQGNYTELSILNNEYMPFDYDFTDWYDHRDYDDYLYYKMPVKRTGALEPLVISLIPDYTLSSFPIYDAGYSLQIAFTLEAVQSFGGPKYEWGQEAPPWDNYGNLVERNNPSTIEVTADKIFGSYANIVQHLNQYYYVGVDGNIYNYSNSITPEYIYDSQTDKFSKNSITYELDINDNLVLSLSPSTIIIENNYLFASTALKDSYVSSLFYTNNSGSLVNMSDVVVYTKNTDTNIYTDGTNEFIMLIIE